MPSHLSKDTLPSMPSKRQAKKHLYKRSALALFTFDYELGQAMASNGIRFVIGVDEVGRGSLIGPVVAAAVCFSELLAAGNKESYSLLAEQLPLVQDSKQLSATQRECCRLQLEQHSCFGIAQASQQEVEELNIQQASLLACWRAASSCLDNMQATTADLSPSNVLLLVDGKFPLPQWPGVYQRALIKGDALSASIAAASVLAKQARDAWVVKEAAHYPAYGWHTNMGYATASHRQAIQSLGPSSLHRRTFLSKILSSQTE